jgi:hypothetical protein
MGTAATNAGLMQPRRFKAVRLQAKGPMAVQDKLRWWGGKIRKNQLSLAYTEGLPRIGILFCQSVRTLIPLHYLYVIRMLGLLDFRADTLPD